MPFSSINLNFTFYRPTLAQSLESTATAAWENCPSKLFEGGGGMSGFLESSRAVMPPASSATFLLSLSDEVSVGTISFQQKMQIYAKLIFINYSLINF